MKFWLICTLALTALLTACGGDQSRIVGRWKVAGGGDNAVWEFASNKGVDMHGRKGKYTLGDQGRLKVQTSSATFVYQLQLAEDRMTLTDPTGAKIQLERVK
jgi:hypothetical protein